MLTLEEQERSAYISGDTRTAELLGQVETLEGEVNALEEQIEEIETLEQWEKNHGPADGYCDFFYDCFEHLGAHYPAPSVTSDHDQSVIFDAIRFGESARELLQRIWRENEVSAQYADEIEAMLNGDT